MNRKLKGYTNLRVYQSTSSKIEDNEEKLSTNVPRYGEPRDTGEQGNPLLIDSKNYIPKVSEVDSVELPRQEIVIDKPKNMINYSKENYQIIKQWDYTLAKNEHIVRFDIALHIFSFVGVLCYIIWRFIVKRPKNKDYRSMV